MRKRCLLSTLVLTVLVCNTLSAQDFSNKGKEFWFCFPNHIPSGANGSMSIWITSDQASSGTITMTNGTFFTTFNVAANGITSINIPHGLAHISNAESGMVIQKSLRISVNPGQPEVVAYAQQYGNARSAATLLLPTAVLGKNYRAASYTYANTSGGGQSSRCQFQVIATQPNTLVRVTPVLNGITQTPFTINLPNTGDMYQYQATSDITGTLIESIATSTGSCLPIAVFSGSSASTIGTTTCTNPNSYDPLFQQLYPLSTWGKSFGFIPFGDYTNGNPYRIMAAEDNTNVFINGSLVATLNAGQIYPNTFNLTPVTLTAPTSITSDRPICVIQYAQTSACSGTNNGDPDMVILNPIEQNISDITIFASTQQNINRQWLNVLIQTSAAPSFRINGAVPSTAFQVALNIPGYSYLRHMFNPAVSGSYRLTADSGFNAIVYGFQGGAFESYAYSAGTNVRDLNQSLEVGSGFGNETSPNACLDVPFLFRVYFPDKSLGTPPVEIRYDSIRWDISNPTVINPPNFPYVIYGSPTVTPDSVNQRNGKDVAWYSLPGTYTINTPGTYTVTITVYRTSSEGCGNSQEYSFPLTVTPRPVASFIFSEPECYLQPVQFTETTPQTPKATYRFWWDFDDPASGGANNSIIRNPTHTFTAAGTYNVRFANITTAGCLSDTIPGTVIIPDVPSATISGDAIVCLNDPSPLISFTGSDGRAPYTFTYNINGGPNQTISTAAGPPAATSVTLPVPTGTAGTFRYNLVEVRNTGSSLCLQPQNSYVEVVVNQHTGLTLTSGSSNQTVCQNSSIVNIVYTISGGGDNATATGLPPGISFVYDNVTKLLTISGTATTPGTYNYTVTATGPCLPNSLQGTITVNPLPTASIAGSTEVCLNGTSPVVTFTGAAGQAPYTFRYRINGVLQAPIVSVGNSATVTVPTGTSGTFVYELEDVTDASITTCSQPQTGTATVIVNALPTAAFTASTPSCESSTITFTDNSLPNSGIITGWSWDFGDGGTSTLQNPTHTYATAGTYAVLLVVTTDKGCESTTPAQQVTVYAKPTADFILPEVCLDDTQAQFTDASTTPAPDVIAAWEWDFGDGGTSTLQNPLHGYLATGPYTVQLIVTTNRGCRDTITQNIFVNGSFPNADFTLLNPTTLCANDSASIVEASTVFPGTITKVEIYWDNVGAPGVFVTDDNPFTGKVYKHLYPNFQTPLTRTFTIRYRAYSGGVCVNDKLEDITVNAAPLVQFNPVPDICPDAPPYQITQATETGGVPGTGVFSGPGVSPSGLFNPAVAGPGVHTIKYLYTSTTGGCQDSTTQTIKVFAPATADFTVSSPACERQPVTFTDNSASTEGTLTQWRWDFGDGTPIVIRNNGNPVTHTYNGYGNFTVRLNVVTSNGCVSADKVTTVDIKPLARPNFTFPAVSCLPNANVTFANTSTIPDGTQSQFTYLWNFGDPGSGPVNTSTAMNPSHTYAGMGPFNVNLQVTSGSGCVHDTTIVLNSIHPEPIGSFTTDNIDVCIGGSITFTSTSNPLDGTTTQWFWDLADGTTRTTPSFTYTYPAPGIYNVRHYIYNSFNCKSSEAVVTVSVNPFPTVNAGPDKFMLEGGQVQLTPTVTSLHPVTYLWSPAAYLDNPTAAMPFASPPDDMNFTVLVTTDKGCSASDVVFVKVLKKPDIPNIFSPNGDGVHDRWEIKYLDTYPGCTVDVVNRYGQLVFRSVGYATAWDGKSNGRDVPVGTYYYVIDPKNGRKPITGYVDIIR